MPAPPRSPVLRVAAAALLALAAAAAVSCLAASSGECRGALGQGRAGRGFAALALMLLPTLAPSPPAPDSRLGWAGAGAAEGPGATAGTSVGSLPLGTERGLFEKFVVDEGRQGGGARSFSIADDKFVLDGSPVRLIVGELHYFRIPRAYWRDRLQRLASNGYNAIQTYVPWNYHEEQKGVFDFSGEKDVTAFLQEAARQGFMVLLRPGPYICAEWDMGGLPWWLLAEPGLEIRTFSPPYIARVTLWWEVMLSKMRPFLADQGGPVVMVQIENEFGSYGDVSKSAKDLKYMQHLISLARRLLGPSIVLYTTDFGNLDAMTRGSLKGDAVYTCGDFGPDNNFTASMLAQRVMNPPGKSPPFCSEYYSGWYTAWGQETTTNTSSMRSVKTLAAMLPLGFSVSVYMAHGGTNFGFWGGANIQEPPDLTNGAGSSGKAGEGKAGELFISLITSYDYSAPISENGEHGVGSDGLDKYLLHRDLFQSFASTPLPPEPAPLPSAAFGEISLRLRARLLDNLDVLGGDVRRAASPLPFEQIGAGSGFVLYSLRGVVSPSSARGIQASKSSDRSSPEPREIHISKLADRAHILVTPEAGPSKHNSPEAGPSHPAAGPSGVEAGPSAPGRSEAGLSTPGTEAETKLLGIVLRGANSSAVFLPPSDKPLRLDILVENLGRVNYGRGQMGFSDRKGLSGVSVGGKPLVGEWEMTPIPLATPPLQETPERFARTHFEEGPTSGEHKPASGLKEGPASTPDGPASGRDRPAPGREEGGGLEAIPASEQDRPASGREEGGGAVGPWIYRGGLFLGEGADPADTFLCTPGLGRKGYVWVNGYNLGMFWSSGPQKALYLPAPMLRAGSNIVTLLELDLPPQVAPVLLSVRRAQDCPDYPSRGGPFSS